MGGMVGGDAGAVRWRCGGGSGEVLWEKGGTWVDGWGGIGMVGRDERGGGSRLLDCCLARAVMQAVCQRGS